MIEHCFCIFPLIVQYRSIERHNNFVFFRVPADVFTARGSTMQNHHFIPLVVCFAVILIYINFIKEFPSPNQSIYYQKNNQKYLPNLQTQVSAKDVTHVKIRVSENDVIMSETDNMGANSDSVGSAVILDDDVPETNNDNVTTEKVCNPRLPTALIIGARKSGTGTLLTFLGRHTYYKLPFLLCLGCSFKSMSRGKIAFIIFFISMKTL